jgi:hypothetical protein
MLSCIGLYTIVWYVLRRLVPWQHITSWLIDTLKCNWTIYYETLHIYLPPTHDLHAITFCFSRKPSFHPHGIRITDYKSNRQQTYYATNVNDVKAFPPFRASKEEYLSVIPAIPWQLRDGQTQSVDWTTHGAVSTRSRVCTSLIRSAPSELMALQRFLKINKHTTIDWRFFPPNVLIFFGCGCCLYIYSTKWKIYVCTSIDGGHL